MTSEYREGFPEQEAPSTGADTEIEIDANGRIAGDRPHDRTPAGYRDWQKAARSYEMDPDAFAQGDRPKVLLTVGLAGAGKSTIQSFLVYRLWSDERIRFEKGKKGSVEHDAILNSWVENFSQGYLPRRTITGLVQDFCVSFGSPRQPLLDLHFLEISGEDIATIVADVDSIEAGVEARFAPQIDSVLERSDIDLRLLFVADATKHLGLDEGSKFIKEDILFSTILEHVRNLRRGPGFGRRIGAVFVASKWDQVLRKDSGARRTFVNEKQFFMREFPRVRGIVNSAQGRIEASYIPFSVGGVKMSEDDEIARITTPESRYGDILISWIYFSFTGRHLHGFPRVKQTALQRFMSMMAFR
jgi:hypothetical protein